MFSKIKYRVWRLSLAGRRIGCQYYIMQSIIHLIRFWILMAVSGSLASGAEDPPPFLTPEVRAGDSEAKMIEPVHFFGLSEGVVNVSLFTVKKLVRFSISKGQS